MRKPLHIFETLHEAQKSYLYTMLDASWVLSLLWRLGHLSICNHIRQMEPDLYWHHVAASRLVVT